MPPGSPNCCVRAEVTSGEHRPLAHRCYENNAYVPHERRLLEPLWQSEGPFAPAQRAASITRVAMRTQSSNEGFRPIASI